MSHKFKTLYSRRGDGGIQEWTIEVESNKYRTICGTSNGKQVVSKWTECQGKNIGRINETTPEEQALLEAKAKHKKKNDSGYQETVGSVDNHGLFKPMLAHKYIDHRDKVFKTGVRVFSDSKINGHRCIVRANGMWTRKGKRIFACPHIFEVLKPLFKANPDLVIDGELYNHNLRHKLNELMELVRKIKCSTEDLAKSRAMVRLYVYDGVGVNGLTDQDLFSKRKPELTKLLQNIDYITMVESVEVFAVEDLDLQYKRLLEEDWEGQMIRIDAPYQHKRTSFLLKRKPFQDAEYIVADIGEGVGNWAGAAKTIICVNPNPLRPEDTTFGAGIKGEYAYLAQVLKDKDQYIGKKATIKYFELTPYGVPQFPVCVLLGRDDN